jgi:hypothetical protein
MRHIICMLVKNSADNDLFESSGALFRKLATNQTAIVYGFFSASYTSYTEASPTPLLKSKNFAPNDDEEIALYINAHGTGGKIADGAAGDVAKRVIEALKIQDKKIAKLVFLACKLQGAENVELSLSKLLTTLNGFNIHKIVIYKSAMTILSPRNLKFIEKVPAPKGVKKPKEMDLATWRQTGEAAAKQVELAKVNLAKSHLDWLTSIMATFKADLENRVDDKETVTAFFNRSNLKWDEATPATIWADAGAAPRTDVSMNVEAMNRARGSLESLHSNPFDHSIWGRRVVVDKKPQEKAKIMLNKNWASVMFADSPLSKTQAAAAVPQAYEGCNGYVYTESDGLKVVWQLTQRQ